MLPPPEGRSAQSHPERIVCGPTPSLATTWMMGGAYILRYRLEGDTLVIIRVWHGREHRN